MRRGGTAAFVAWMLNLSSSILPLRLGSQDRAHRDRRSIHLSLDGYALPGKFIELALVTLQRVRLAAADEGKVGSLLDAFPGAPGSGFSLHHVMRAAHGVAYSSS